MTATPRLREPDAPAPAPYENPAARDWRCPPFGAGVREFHASLSGHTPTPLTELPTLAAELGVGRVFVKDESDRLGLPAFKALGASWAVHRIVAEHADSGAPPSGLTLVTATEGNHGRALARMARRFGQRAHVFVPEGVHPDSVAAVAAEGARVTEVDGSYETAILRAAEAAREPGALLVQDTGWPGYERIPGWIVEGYSTLFAEIDDQLAAAGAEPAGLVAVPVGVGSLAQAAVTHYRGRPRDPAPALLSVEPAAAPCVLASLRHGAPVDVPTGETAMTGLVSSAPSHLAWPFLRDGIDAAVAVTEAEAGQAGRDLAALGVPAGPCGAASLAGARTAPSAPTTGTVVLLSTESPAANPRLP